MKNKPPQEDSSLYQEKKRLEQLSFLADISRRLTFMETAEVICSFVCNKIKELAGRGYVFVTLMDESTQTLSLRAMEGLQDEGIVNNILRILGADPRGMAFSVNDIIDDELTAYRSGKMELIPGGTYALLMRKFPKAACDMVDRLLNISSVYTIGFIHHNRHLGGVIILTNSQNDIEENRDIIETILSQASVALSRIFTEHVLQEDEKKYRTIVENMYDVFYRTDKEGNIIYVSPSGARLLGVDSVEKIYHMNVAKDFYTNPEERNTLLQKLYTDGSVIDYEVALKRFDGSIIFVSTNSRMVRDDNDKEIGVEGVFRDITERKNNEELLRTNELKIRSLLEESARAQRALLSILEDEMEAQDKIRVLNEELEKRVLERTRELDLTNQNLLLKTEELEDKNTRLADEISERIRIEEELKKKSEELETFNKAMVGRELRIIEMKEEVNLLCAQLGIKPKYVMDWKDKKQES
ncbi:MAG: PAS domain S-box protein [Bacteroidetes bacterium]|nr:PAS domain S-box protein [Bacteroidota bacterium]